MDGKGQYFDNIFIERFWHSYNYEEMYLNAYDSVLAARTAADRYIIWYNTERLHQALGYKTPQQVFDHFYTIPNHTPC